MGQVSITNGKQGLVPYWCIGGVSLWAWSFTLGKFFTLLWKYFYLQLEETVTE